MDTGLSEKVRRLADQTGDIAARRLFRETQDVVPTDSGQLKRSGYVRRQGSGRWEIGYRDRKASWTDNSPPHVIRPRRAGGRLVFFWPRVGRVVWARKVNHPGVQLRWWSSTVTRSNWVEQLRRALARR